MSKKQINAQKSANQSTQSTQSVQSTQSITPAEPVQPNVVPEVQRDSVNAVSETAQRDSVNEVPAAQRDSVKKVLTEEQKRKRLEYHKKYEAAHKEQVKAWHKAYYERKREEKRKKKEEQAWIEERINAGKKDVKVTKTSTSATFTEVADGIQTLLQQSSTPKKSKK